MTIIGAGIVDDRSRFQEPFVLATGMKGVWVRGARVWDAGQPTGAMPVQMLSR